MSLFLEERHSGSPRPLLGYFPAGSNVTGVLNEDLVLTALLHANGALAFWDYTSVAPLVNIDMNPQVEI